MEKNKQIPEDKLLMEVLPFFHRIPLFVFGILASVWFLIRGIANFWSLDVLPPLVILLISVFGIGLSVGICIGYVSKKLGQEKTSSQNKL